MFMEFWNRSKWHRNDALFALYEKRSLKSGRHEIGPFQFEFLAPREMGMWNWHYQPTTSLLTSGFAPNLRGLIFDCDDHSTKLAEKITFISPPCKMLQSPNFRLPNRIFQSIFENSKTFESEEKRVECRYRLSESSNELSCFHRFFFIFTKKIS